MRAVNDNAIARANAQVRADARAVLIGIEALKANLSVLADIINHLENTNRR